MILLLKLLRSIIKGIVSQAAPWQIVVGTILGLLIGILPLMPHGLGPSPLGFALIAVALVINCHLGSVIGWFGVGLGLSKLLAIGGQRGPAVVVGQWFDGVARWAADVGWANSIHLSHQGHLGLTIIGLILAPLAGWGMYVLTLKIRVRLLTWKAERKKTAALANIASTPILVKMGMWFFGV